MTRAPSQHHHTQESTAPRGSLLLTLLPCYTIIRFLETWNLYSKFWNEVDGKPQLYSKRNQITPQGWMENHHLSMQLKFEFIMYQPTLVLLKRTRCMIHPIMLHIFWNIVPMLHAYSLMILFWSPQNCLRIQPKTLLKNQYTLKPDQEGSQLQWDSHQKPQSQSHRLSMPDLGSIFWDKIPAFNHVPLAAFFSFCFSLFFLLRNAFLPIALN